MGEFLTDTAMGDDVSQFFLPHSLLDDEEDDIFNPPFTQASDAALTPIHAPGVPAPNTLLATISEDSAQVSDAALAVVNYPRVRVPDTTWATVNNIDPASSPPSGPEDVWRDFPAQGCINPQLLQLRRSYSEPHLSPQGPEVFERPATGQPFVSPTKHQPPIPMPHLPDPKEDRGSSEGPKRGEVKEGACLRCYILKKRVSLQQAGMNKSGDNSSNVKLPV